MREYETLLLKHSKRRFKGWKADTSGHRTDEMYVNYYTREMMNEGSSLPIGIILCADKSDSVVKYTLPEDNRLIFASKYKLYMPTEEELKRELEKEQELLETGQKL